MAATEGRKKKRWSLGGLFRRRRGGGGSSSDDEVGSRDVSGQFVMTKASSWANVTQEPRRRRRPEPESSSDDGSCREGSVASTSSLSRRSRAARTERYLRRQHQAQTTQRAPPTPPERRSSRRLGTPRGDLETALGELEAIYDSLRSAEEEVLPRRSPRPADDMAVRRWTRAATNVRDSREVLSQAGSYLLLTPTLSPPPPPYPRPLHEPDTTLDDVVFRSLTQRNNALKVADPQPPFGIPLGPVSPAPLTDYLHAEPEDEPDGGPNVVLDDLAFRNLRKDRGRSLSANLSQVLRSPSLDREVNNNLVDCDSKSDQVEEIPQDLRLAQRMLDIRLNNIRNKIKEQERSSDEGHAFREPQRARYGADGSRYADLHAAQQRLIIRDDIRTQDSKSAKEELRRRFFAEAYRNLDKAGANFKPPPKPPGSRHDKEHQRPPIHYQGSVDGYVTRNQLNGGVQYHQYQNARKSPSPQIDYYQIPGSPKSRHHNDAYQPQFRPQSYRSYSAPQYNVEQMYVQNTSPSSSRHNSPGLYLQNGSPEKHHSERHMRSPPQQPKNACISYQNINGESKSHKQGSPRASRHKSPAVKISSRAPQEKANGEANGRTRSKSPSRKHHGSPTPARQKNVSNGSPASHRRRSPNSAPPTSPLSRRKFDPNTESFPKMEYQKHSSPSTGRHKPFKQDSPVTNRKSVGVQSSKQNEKFGSDKSSTLSSQSSVEHHPHVASFPPKHHSPSSARRQAYKQSSMMNGKNTKSTWDSYSPLDFKEPLTERPPTIGRSDVSLFTNSPTLEELYLMYSNAGNDERIVEGEEGRASPSGEEVRRIFEAGEESILLKKLEEEAKATSLQVDQQLQRLAEKTPETDPYKELNCLTTLATFNEPIIINNVQVDTPKVESDKFALYTIDTRAEIVQEVNTPDSLEVEVTKETVSEVLEEPVLVTLKSSDESKSSGVDTPTITEDLNSKDILVTEKGNLKEDLKNDSQLDVTEDDVDRGSRIFNDAVEQLNSLSASESGSCYSLDRKGIKRVQEDLPEQQAPEEARNFAGDIEQMRQECDKIGDILNELARDLERTSPPTDEVLDKVRDETGSQVISVAYCMAVAEQFTYMDPLTVLAIMFAIASLFLFLYL